MVITDLLIFKETDGYSGSDIRLVCKEAAMRPVRKIFDTLENHSEGKVVFSNQLFPLTPVLKYTFSAQFFVCTGHSLMPLIKLETVTTADFLQVIAHTKPSARNLIDRFSAWEREYESV